MQEVRLDEVTIKVTKLFQENINGLHKITIVFPVRSEEYHDTAVLLYRKEFKVTIPSNNIEFEGRIVQFYTSITDLYKEGNVGEYTVSLLEKD